MTMKYNNMKKYKLIQFFCLFLLCTMLCGCNSKTQEKKYEKLSDFNDTDVAIGVVNGYIFDDIVSENLPDAELKYFDNRENAYRALNSGIVDAVADDEPIIRAALRSTDEIAMIEGYLEASEYAFVFTKDEKGEKLSCELSEYIKILKESGELKDLDDKWFGNQTDNKKSDDIDTLEATNGTLKLVFEDNNIPFSYMSAGKPVGYDIDIAIGFCREYGYGLDIYVMDFQTVLTGTAKGTYDMGCGSITVSDERKEELYFSEPDYSGGASLCVAKTGHEKRRDIVFFNGIKRNFKRAFIDKQRYILFIKGIIITLFITAFSIVVGIPFGFLLFILSRRSGIINRALSKALVWVLHGMPAIMLIMILYYSYYIDMYRGGVISAILGFGLVFSASVYKIIERYATKADSGKVERDYRLYAYDTKEFFNKLFGLYKKDMVYDFSDKVSTLIKSTAVVGYIAVYDMTKIFDVIRTQSLEIGIPLLFTTLAYFIIIKIVNVIICRIFER